MISEKNKEFTLHTKNTSYLFRVNATNHLEHLYYGRRINSDLPLQPLYFKNTLPLEHAVAYNEEHPTYSLNNICLEYSFYAKGDYRESALLYSLADGNRV
ncbi:MAG: glycoside hydrolase family 36 N-terminal domain-containing protein, partial [Sphaerochaetaceae bacterium]